MTDLEGLSARIRACADKHGVWDDVVRKVERDQENSRYWDWFFKHYGYDALANADTSMNIGTNKNPGS